MQQRSPAFFAMIVLGAILLVAGIVYGLGSRYVQYKSVTQGSILHYLSADGTGYLQMEDNPALYIVHEDNFSPKLPTLADSDTIYFVYDPAETTAIDERSTIGTHLVGNAAKVVAITEVATSGKQSYTTPEYVNDPQGYNHNQWPLGIGLIVVGLLLIGGSFFLPRNKPAAVANTPTSAYMPMQPQQPGTFQQNTPPYGQPLQQGFPATPFPPTQQTYPSQAGTFQQTPFPSYPQQTSAPFGPSAQQPGPFGQTQQPQHPQHPQHPQQVQPSGPPEQRPSKPSGSQFMMPKPYRPPHQ